MNKPSSHDHLSPPAAVSQAEPEFQALVVSETRHRPNWYKLILFGVSLFLFVLGIVLMKEGAGGLTPFVRDTLAVNNPVNSMGFGWLFAYLIMSGSPVAASALALYDNATLDSLSTFSMITGSRLGAGFIVLFIGFIYILRGRDRATSLSMGLLTFIITYTTYLPGLFVGVGLLKSGVLDSIRPQSSTMLASITDMIFDPVISICKAVLPLWGIFLFGLFVIIASFQLFDKCLPTMTLKESQVGHTSRLVYRPLVMFLLGAGVTMISMSVSMSLSILVPLSDRGFIRRENVIPYIMGANITTFIDTLFAAILINNPGSITIVVAEMLSISIISILILAFIYHPYKKAMLNFVNWVMERDKNLFYFILLIFIVPIILILL
jgi:sodium-dependent phosphate cotransporter